MKLTKLMFTCQLFLSLNLFAQEAMPEMTAKHGGIIQKTEHTILELVQEKDRTSVYISGHDHKNITSQKLSISAIAKIDDLQYPLQVSFENDHYSIHPANSYLHKEKNMVLLITISLPTTMDRASFKLKTK